ncbi:hypothetical protein KSP35_23200 [Aquihabitans sp. G128]|uniref:hypothetical protein n=1 Tax=Aquihabitans sp. G128 TaxID=2849779 RepID=UPI001C23FA8B|nr:hypothetical protein [Aquihabitans sp. G128]QXC61181.1 hypothetical protein KSP35_23200 [Aquihabitans sp. G128]
MFALVPVDTFGYKLMLLLHIVTIVVAFAPGFVLPGLRRKVAAEGDGASRAFAAAAAANDTRIHGPALVLAGLFGFGLVGMSKKFYEFSQPWISVGMLLWFIMLGMVFAVLLPAEKKVAAGDASAQKLVGMAGGIIHLLFLVQVIVMIWKPGL